MGDPVPLINASHVSKHFCGDLKRSLRYGLADVLADLAPRQARRGRKPLRRGEFAALEDISFELRAGEGLAVLGANGAGKSTLLKILNGVIKPDAGEVHIRGRIGALLDLGGGFDPILSGRENIAASAAAVGLDSRELRAATADIIEFSELEDSIDSPVRYYSAGMAARLAFAVAAHLEPDVLLIDEVLAVGDIGYQRKCLTHIMRHLERGGSLIFVSHNPHLTQTTCSRGIVLEHGRCVFHGSAVDAVARHLAAEASRPASSNYAAQRGAGTAPSSPVAVEHCAVGAPDGHAVATGEALEVVVGYRCHEPIEIIWGFSIFTADGWVCAAGAYDGDPRRLAAGTGELRCMVPSLPLLSGSYLVKLAISETSTMRPVARVGYTDAPMPLEVRAAPSAIDNAMAAMGQLTKLDVEWR